jgi:hypothetical protein
MKMRKIFTFFALTSLIVASCKKSDLQLVDPNSPTPTSVFSTKAGIEQFSLGMWNKLSVGNNLLVHNLEMHSFMGDEQFSSVGNWGWRYVNQVDKITLPAPYNTVVPGVLGLSQPAQLKALNNLTATNGSATNAIVYEWNMSYYINNQANLLLKALDGGTVTLPEAELTTLKAWAYWWKGFAYSHLGSMYLSAVINNASDGTTNNTFVGRDAIIIEANANFDKAISLLNSISATDMGVYTSTIALIIPSFNVTNPLVTRDMWVRDCNTYKARNILVNKKVSAMTAADWASIKTLTAAGLVANDQTFSLGMDPGGLNDLSGTQQHPYQWNSYKNNPGWAYPSERWIQDFKTGDARFTKGVTAFPAAEVIVNRSSRGIQFGTRYYFTAIENGGYWSTNNKQGKVQFAGSWEENSLMLAEANIRTGAIEDGLRTIDAVRTANGAGLAPVAGTGLLLPAALEELRRERRVALTIRGLAFFDARRWNITAPVSAGGGRPGAMVIIPNSLPTPNITPTSGWTLMPSLVDYNYLDYWDVPVSEFSYNEPAPGSAPTAN